ncbi:MAG: pyridoxal phosphate-dependent aminotransferase, partial [Clostridiales bacterium]|nr:pyridoxal phosphate-dependent aminotransferase [Clostridiales bacterium]
MPRTISEKARRIAPSATLAMDAKAKALKAQGISVVSFAAGEPDFDTPLPIRDAMKEAMDQNMTRYTPVSGTAELKDAIIHRFEEDHGLHYDPQEIIVSNGAKHSLYTLFQTILDPGDEVIIPTPCWVSYPEMVRMAGGTPIFVEMKKEHGFVPTNGEILAAITPRTKAFLLTSPNNPTGCMYSKETLDAIHEVLKDRPVFVICDDVYRTLTYVDGYHSFAEYQDMRDRIVVVQSYSKPYAMTGWRVGYLLADKAVKSRLEVFHQYAVTSVPAFIQPACVKALENDTAPMVEIFRKRRDYIYRRLTDMGFAIQEPQGAFYVFVDVRKYGMDSITFCERMLRESLVGAIPGIYFGTEGYIRLSYCYSDADL